MRLPWLPALLFASAIALGTSLPLPARAQRVALRDVDAATARVVAIAAGSVHDPGSAGSAGTWWGTGFFVSAGGQMVTAAHVVAEAHTLVVIPAVPTAPVALARVIYFDPEHDIAVIQVECDTAPGVIDMTRAGRERVVAGDQISVSGYSGSDAHERSPAVTVGHISRQTASGTVELAAAINPGQSGGPVLSDDGTVLGLVSARATPESGVQSVAFIEPRDRIVAALAAAPAQTQPVTARTSLAELACYASGSTSLSELPQAEVLDAWVQARRDDERVLVLLAAHRWVQRERARVGGAGSAAELEHWAHDRATALIAAAPFLCISYPPLAPLAVGAAR
jgi:S1-C subfamily serine protease